MRWDKLQPLPLAVGRRRQGLSAVAAGLREKVFVVTINGAKVGSKTIPELIQPLDRGDFDNRELLATLREIGYRGPIGLQCFGIPGDARQHLQRSMKVWKTWKAEWAKEGPLKGRCINNCRRLWLFAPRKSVRSRSERPPRACHVGEGESLARRANTA